MGARAQKGAAIIDIGGGESRLEPAQTYDIWHNRVCFHFLTEAADRKAYADCAARGVSPWGHLIIGTFAPDGPQRCSGLPIERHDAASIAVILGKDLALVESRRHDHRTPTGQNPAISIQPVPAHG